MPGVGAHRDEAGECGHGSEADSQFYGQKGSSYPPVLRSTSLLKRTKEGTVTGAMCCYGASVFDPAGAANAAPGEPPIPSVYLRQGAYGLYQKLSNGEGSEEDADDCQLAEPRG